MIGWVISGLSSIVRDDVLRQISVFVYSNYPKPENCRTTLVPLDLRKCL